MIITFNIKINDTKFQYTRLIVGLRINLLLAQKEKEKGLLDMQP